MFNSAQVVVYVDGTRVGEALASEETPHHIIHRLCELDLAVSDLQQPPQQKGVGFRLKLPNLMQGKHEVRSVSLPLHIPAQVSASLRIRLEGAWNAMCGLRKPHRGVRCRSGPL